MLLSLRPELGQGPTKAWLGGGAGAEKGPVLGPTVGRGSVLQLRGLGKDQLGLGQFRELGPAWKLLRGN